MEYNEKDTVWADDKHSVNKNTNDRCFNTFKLEHRPIVCYIFLLLHFLRSHYCSTLIITY